VIEDLDLKTIQEAEELRESLISTNRLIDCTRQSGQLHDGTKAGTEQWSDWERRARRKKRDNEEKIRRINLWIKNCHREETSKIEPLDELLTSAKAAFYKLLDHCKAQQIEIEELRRGQREAAVLADDHSLSGR